MRDAARARTRASAPTRIGCGRPARRPRAGQRTPAEARAPASACPTRRCARRAPPTHPLRARCCAAAA
ncbi:hypothetical protein FJ657_11945 [Schumannella soli]|uniref:Uncharacterized protein n=1 Tax=Schumannella soli TaxID=2590779 RepID=A0A506Y494_9MICO|nr:hypothetical protein FJ657_11945 [Schumannella soli]